MVAPYDYSLIGINAVILNGAINIGKYRIIGANSLIGEGKVIPDVHSVMGFTGQGGSRPDG